MSNELTHGMADNALAASLKQDADRINTLHRALAGTLAQAVQIGFVLTEVKEVVGHGKWLAWIEENLEFSHQTVSNYMRCYEFRDKLQTDGTFNITQTYKFLAGKGQRALKPTSTQPSPPAAPEESGEAKVYEIPPSQIKSDGDLPVNPVNPISVLRSQLIDARLNVPMPEEIREQLDKLIAAIDQLSE
jgi:Protein of unknown function (DUF3102)